MDLIPFACKKLNRAALSCKARILPVRVSGRLNCCVIDMHTVKPLDREAVRACAAESGRIITVEDHNIINGLGGAVCEAVSDIRNVVVHRIGIQDQFGQSAPYERLLEHNGITVEHIVGTAKEMVLCKD